MRDSFATGPSGRRSRRRTCSVRATLASCLRHQRPHAGRHRQLERRRANPKREMMRDQGMRRHRPGRHALDRPGAVEEQEQAVVAARDDSPRLQLLLVGRLSLVESQRGAGLGCIEHEVAARAVVAGRPKRQVAEDDVLRDLDVRPALHRGALGDRRVHQQHRVHEDIRPGAGGRARRRAQGVERREPRLEIRVLGRQVRAEQPQALVEDRALEIGEVRLPGGADADRPPGRREQSAGTSGCWCTASSA